jgi:biopolymer transport protein ExbD
MAEKRQFIDVWIVESNTVYRDVPYTVVTDWVQQGRLLEDDHLRPSGTADWHPLGTLPAFAAYLPKPAPFRAEDQAEALEPVELDFAWRHARGEEDEDVDMIPLIDVSLVLLIFFMMTATVAGGAAFIKTPTAREGTQATSEPDSLWVGIDQGRDNQPVYSLGKANNAPERDDQNLTEREVVDRLQARLQRGQTVDVRIKAHHALPYEVVKHLTVNLERLRNDRRVAHVYAEVSEKE